MATSACQLLQAQCRCKFLAKTLEAGASRIIRKNAREIFVARLMPLHGDTEVLSAEAMALREALDLSADCCFYDLM